MEGEAAIKESRECGTACQPLPRFRLCMSSSGSEHNNEHKRSAAIPGAEGSRRRAPMFALFFVASICQLPD